MSGQRGGAHGGGQPGGDHRLSGQGPGGDRQAGRCQAADLLIFLLRFKYFQRRQAGGASSADIVRSTWRGEGLRGFYRGYVRSYRVKLELV